jgi:nucleoside-diphosphate-sugar epimerase
MKCLVTGSSGLLGHCLVERLEERGDQLQLADIAPPEGDGHREDHPIALRDISGPGALDDLAAGVDVIYHLAAAQRMKPQFQWSEERIFNANLEAVRNVLGAAERCGVPKVVHVSSSGIYGVPRTVPVGEDHPQEPLGRYGESKIEAERLCREALDRGLDVTAVRPMTLFGPRMTGVFTILFEWVRLGKPVFLLGSGRNRVQGVSSWDVADACIAAVQSPRSRGAMVNLGAEPDGVPTVREWTEQLIAHAGGRSPVVCIPAALLRNTARVLDLFGVSPIVPEHYKLADSDFILDIQAAKDALGWQPKYDNARMLAQAYDWYVGLGDDARPRQHPVVRMLNAAMPTFSRRS